MLLNVSYLYLVVRIHDEWFKQVRMVELVYKDWLKIKFFHQTYYVLY